MEGLGGALAELGNKAELALKDALSLDVSLGVGLGTEASALIRTSIALDADTEVLASTTGLPEKSLELHHRALESALRFKAVRTDCALRVIRRLSP